MEITFLGAAGTVTGSKFLIRSGSTSLLVDCGLFQGLKELRLRNRAPLAFDPADVSGVALSHAHLDHSGFLPVLLRAGFRGPVYCTVPTADLCEILLMDSARIQEEDAAYANRKGFSRHSPALPLYDTRDAERALHALRPTEMGREVRVGPLRVTFSRAGHILGAASVLVEDRDCRVLFSGDLGRSDDVLMPPPAPPPDPDWVVMESTYGDRCHPEDDPLTALAPILSRTIERRGVVLIPSFAVGRSQTMLYCLYRLFSEGLVPRVPVFLNSPMAIDVTRLYRGHHVHHRLDEADVSKVFAVANYVESVSASKELNQRQGPMIVVAGAGMLSGGRILHHLKAFGGDERTTIILPGYQAEGTRGAALLAGETHLKIHGDYWPVRAEVIQLNIFSAHADQGDLVSWLGACCRPPRGVFLVHGEPGAVSALAGRIHERLGIAANAARDGERAVLH